MSTDKQPLMQGHAPGPSAPPPAYQPPTGSAPAYTPPTQPGYAPPPQHGGYGGISQQQTTVIMQPAQHRTVVMEIKPPNYIVLSVVTMLFFCWVFGLIALVIGSQVDSAWMRGDRAEAHSRSRQARIWNIIGMVVGVVVYVGIVTVSVAANVSINSSYNN